MDSIEEKRFQSNKIKLRIVLVISLIGTFMNSISNFMRGLMMPLFAKADEAGQFAYLDALDNAMSGMYGGNFQGMFRESYELMMSLPRGYYLGVAPLYAMAFIGCIMMWNLHKNGFHLYSLGQLLVVLVTVIFLGRDMVNYGQLMMTLLFITFYFIMFKSLGAFGNKADEDEQNEETPSNTEEPTE
ncbi:MAG: hypothetical protein K5864_00795 [Bacteroidales bacterium]|nr:hypothetical protein [Bacteroidales bacterium]